MKFKVKTEVELTVEVFDEDDLQKAIKIVKNAVKDNMIYKDVVNAGEHGNYIIKTSGKQIIKEITSRSINMNLNKWKNIKTLF